MPFGTWDKESMSCEFSGLAIKETKVPNLPGEKKKKLEKTWAKRLVLSHLFTTLNCKKRLSFHNFSIFTVHLVNISLRGMT